jgi:hypothetical protein
MCLPPVLQDACSDNCNDQDDSTDGVVIVTLTADPKISHSSRPTKTSLSQISPYRTPVKAGNSSSATKTSNSSTPVKPGNNSSATKDSNSSAPIQASSSSSAPKTSNSSAPIQASSSSNSPAKEKKATAEAPTGSWGPVIGQGWPAYTGPGVDHTAPYKTYETRGCVEVGLYGRILSGDGAGKRVSMPPGLHVPKGVMLGDRVEWWAEAVPNTNGGYNIVHRMFDHHWAAAHSDLDPPTTTIQHMEQTPANAIKLAKYLRAFATARRAECW